MIPQEHPILADGADGVDLSTSVIAILDAVVASGKRLHQHLAFLPVADDFAAVDLAVRLWASANGMHLIEWGQWSGPDHWIEGIKIAADRHGFSEVVTLHTPQELRRREPDSNHTLGRVP